MTEDKVIELAVEETRKAFPELETKSPSYFLGIVQQAANTIIKDYSLDVLESEDLVKKLIATDVGSLKEALKWIIYYVIKGAIKLSFFIL